MPDGSVEFLTAFQAAGAQERARMIIDAAHERASAVYDRHRAGAQWLPQRACHIDGLRKAVLFLLVRNEADIIGQNLRHHYGLGFRRFFILDNGSTDETAEIIKQFRFSIGDANVFYAYDYIPGHYQAVKMKALEAFMKIYLSYEEDQPEWLFFVDADEFITCCCTDVTNSISQFNDVLSSANRNILIFHWALCGSAKPILRLPGNVDVFDTFPAIWPTMKVPVSKIAYRLGKGLEPISGNHAVVSYPYEADSATVMADLGVYLLHFPNRTIEQLRKKITNVNTALAPLAKHDGLRNDADHWRTYYKWYMNHGDGILMNILMEHINSCKDSR